jgi:hypothetical protein
MNAFYEHHKDTIRFGYRCFDRIPLNGLIQPFQQPERVVGFSAATGKSIGSAARCCAAPPSSPRAGSKSGRKMECSDRRGAKGLRDEFVEPDFKGAKRDQVVVMLKARETTGMMTASGDKKVNRWHLQIAERWIVRYNFYVNDRRWGRLFVRVCPYLPFSARV